MTIRVVVVGDAGVGKTMLVSSFISRERCPKVPKVLTEVTLPAQVNPDGVPMTLVDTNPADAVGVQRAVDSANAVIAVFALDNKLSLASLESKWLPMASRQGVPIIVLANKHDLPQTSASVNWENCVSEVTERLMTNHLWVCTVLETSAGDPQAERLGYNLENAFFLASRAVVFPITPLIHSSRPPQLSPKAIQAFCWVFYHFALKDEEYEDVTAVRHLISDRALGELQKACFGSAMIDSELSALKELLRKNTPHNGEALLLQGPGGVNRLTLAGFLYTQLRYLEKPTLRYDVPWKVLRGCRNSVDPRGQLLTAPGFDDRLMLDPKFCSGLQHQESPGCRIELTGVGTGFVAGLFPGSEKRPATIDELRHLFDICSGAPFGEEAFFASMEQGSRMSLEEFLAQWRMLLSIEPVRTLEYLRMLGAPHSRAQDLAELLLPTSPDRAVFQVLVMGSHGCGKTSFLNSLNHRPGGHAPVGGADRNVVRMLDQRKYLVLREVEAKELDELQAQVDQMHSDDVLARCDLMCVLYDPNSPESMQYAEALHRMLLQRAATTPQIFLRTKFDQCVTEPSGWSSLDDQRVAETEPPRLSLTVPYEMISSLEGFGGKDKFPILRIHEQILQKASQLGGSPRSRVDSPAPRESSPGRHVARTREPSSWSLGPTLVWGSLLAAVVFVGWKSVEKSQLKGRNLRLLSRLSLPPPSSN